MAPPSRSGGLNKKSDSILHSITDESQEAGVYKGNVSSNSPKRESRLKVSFKPSEYSFIAILKRKARDLTIDVTSDDDLMLSFKTTKKDLGILHATKTRLLLPWRKSRGSPREQKMTAMRAGVDMDWLKTQAEDLAPVKHYDQNDSSSKLKMSSFSIVSESNENKYSVCSIIPKEKKKEANSKVSGFGVAIAGTSEAYVPIHSKSEVSSECAVNEFGCAPFSSEEDESLSLNSDEDCVVISSSFNDRKRRMNATIGLSETGKLYCPHICKL